MDKNADEVSEEDTKLRYITPAIQRAGWSVHSMLTEYSLRSDRYRIVPQQNKTIKEEPPKRNRPDYILCRKANFPIAVVEAKKYAKTAQDGIDQAIAYAKLLDVPFAFSSSGKDFIEYDFSNGKQTVLPLSQFPSPDTLWNRWCDIRHVTKTDQQTFDKAPYYTSADGKIPRYYQMVAINKTVNAVIAEHRKRLLLVMATGTGKTYTAFQIVWRLRHAGIANNVLYLADRNQLIDQTISGDFAPMGDMTKIQHGKIDTSYQIYFGLYQQLKGRDSKDDAEKGDLGDSFADHFRQVPPDYFNLIIVDECHRGSAREESSWRDILNYFDSAIQIGLTATPNDKEGANNEEYFGAPVYVYTLKQGIEDGFLAPYQVVRVHLDKDTDGWEPKEGELDDDGKPIPVRRYTLSDFGTVIELKERTRVVARKITEYLQHLGRMSKTIVFCNTQKHAANMRDAIRECNQDMMQQNPAYCVRMTADDDEGKSLYSDFTSVNEPYPVVVTTSKLLSTGADTKCVKLIVLDSNILSLTEFKQIIGRGTRLRPDAGKTFFTILDFRNVTTLFSDPKFDGDPDDTAEWGEGDPVPSAGGGKSKTHKPNGKHDGDGNDGDDDEDSGDDDEKIHQPIETYTVSGVDVTVTGTSVSYLDENGKLVTMKFEDYTRRNILSVFGSENEFVEVWNGPEAKQEIIDRLQEKGVLFEELKTQLGSPDIDEFDMICSIAFGRPPMTRDVRADKARRSKFLEKYQGIAREVLETLIDIYARDGVTEVDNISVLKNPEFNQFRGMVNIIKNFGSKAKYLEAVKGLEAEFYAPGAA
jgi:type I restriction enzyme R subunit